MQNFFEDHGQTFVCQADVTIEEMFQAFQIRMVHERAAAMRTAAKIFLKKDLPELQTDGDYVFTDIAPEDRRKQEALERAAPKLLAALKELVEEARENMTGGAGHLIDNAYEAIAEAEGR